MVPNSSLFYIYRKVASSRLSWLVAHFQTVYEGEFLCLCTVTFGQKGPKLNSRPVYWLQLYGSSPCIVPNDLTYKFLEVQDLLWTLVAVHQQPLLPSGRAPLAPILERRNFYPLH